MIPITRVYGRFFIRVVFFLGFLKENMQGRLTKKKNIQKTQTAKRPKPPQDDVKKEKVKIYTRKRSKGHVDTRRKSLYNTVSIDEEDLLWEWNNTN